MKKSIIALLMAVMVVSVAGTAYAGTPIKDSELPKAAVAFIKKYFPSETIRKAEKDNGRRGMEYEVDFTSGAEVEFTSDGNWKDVKAARGNALPAGIVPSAISKYVETNHKGQSIVEISRKRGGYEDELSNGKEIKLTEDGKPFTGERGERRGGGRRR